jgi:hypothetical protein
MKTQLSCFPHGGLTIRLISIKTTWPVLLVSLCLGLLMWSCNINPSLQEVSQPKGNLAVADTKIVSSASLLSGTVSLDKVDLYLDRGAAATGSVLVEIRDSQTNAVMGNVNVPVGSLALGRSWNTFIFVPALSLIGGKKYQIHIIRSDGHNYPAGNYVFWQCSTGVGNIDAYPDGINDVYPAWTLDYAFKTYTPAGIDQQQTSYVYGFAIGNNATRWQEFKADYAKVSLKKIALNLTLGVGTRGTVNMQIWSADGSTLLGSSLFFINPKMFLLEESPEITYWVPFNFNVTLYRDRPYRIYVTRSGYHDYQDGNYISWHTSSSGVDAYPDGVNDAYPSLTLDYAFRTYSAINGLDQYQDLTDSAFFLSNNSYRWQEFIPRKQ